MTENETNPGYTREPFKMLETEEGQLNAVFACYGSAAQHAQTFEQGLVRLLMAYNRIADRSVSIEELETSDEALRKRTMGQLLKQLSNHVKFAEKSAPNFDTALEARNYLMHRFFLECNDSFASEEGRMGLLVALRAVEGILERGRIMINAIRYALCEKFGLDADAIGDEVTSRTNITCIQGATRDNVSEGGDTVV